MNYVDRALPTTLHHVHACDFTGQTELAGVYSYPSLDVNYPELRADATAGPFKGWPIIPPMVCIALSVPRSQFTILDDESSAHEPRIAAGIGSRKASHHFATMEAFYGKLAVEGRGVLARAYVEEDPLGKGGDSPIIVTFCLPSYLLCREPFDTEVRLSVICTPHHTPLYYKLDVGRFYVVPLLSDNVHVLAARPIVRGEPPAPVLVNRTVARARPREDSPRVSLDPAGHKVVSLTRRIDIRDLDLRATLADKSNEVRVSQANFCALNLSIGHYTRLIDFFYPVTADKARIKFSRREAWVEITAPPAKFGRFHGPLALNRSPVLGTDMLTCTFAWNLHRLSLSKLPRLSVVRPERLNWVKRHVDLSLSDWEQHVCELGPVEDALTSLKLTINSIIKDFVGSVTPRDVFVLTSEDDSTPNIILLIEGVRLDLEAHTVVADGYVFPVTMVDVHKALQMLDQVPSFKHLQLGQSELTAWKYLIPALVERCRDWRHKDDCPYVAVGEVPLTTTSGFSPICFCGVGRVTPEFTQKADRAPFAPHVTRIALSPLFSVSYLESTAQSILRSQTGILDLARDHELPVEMLQLLALGPSSRRWDNSDTMCLACGVWIPRYRRKTCSGCKQAAYCNEKCQRQDWPRHKQNCPGRRR